MKKMRYDNRNLSDYKKRVLATRADTMREKGIAWKTISNRLQVSPPTLKRWIIEFVPYDEVETEMKDESKDRVDKVDKVKNKVKNSKDKLESNKIESARFPEYQHNQHLTITLSCQQWASVVRALGYGKLAISQAEHSSGVGGKIEKHMQEAQARIAFKLCNRILGTDTSEY